jgi:hypothetical protein
VLDTYQLLTTDLVGRLRFALSSRCLRGRTSLSKFTTQIGGRVYSSLFSRYRTPPSYVLTRPDYQTPTIILREQANKVFFRCSTIKLRAYENLARPEGFEPPQPAYVCDETLFYHHVNGGPTG